MLEIISQISDSEDNKTIILFEEFKSLHTQDFLSKEQLLKILHWKSPRPLNHYQANTEKEIREITTLAFATDNDALKIHILTALKGVSYPSASAILMFYNPQIFPVLDIRVWRQLYCAKFVNTNQRGQNFTMQQCSTYFQIIRQIASELELSARQVEKRLFDYDIENQQGRLYGKN